MHFFKCDDIQAWTGGKWYKLDTAARPEIHGFSTDSRNMGNSFAFVAIKAARDGHDFAEDAVKNGATAIIAERELDVGVPVLVVEDCLKAFQRIAKMHRLRFEWPVIGVTGSCGKTSTKEMLAKLISWKNPLCTEGNFNNDLGIPLTLTKIDTRANQAAVIEAGVSGTGQMDVLAEMIEPDIALITNVGLAHMEGFGEIGNVAKEKAKLAAHTAPFGWALFHHNLLSWKAFDELKCRKAILAPTEAPDIRADLVFRYSLVEAGENIGIDMSIEGGADYYFEVCKMSDGMIDNALLSIAAALMVGTKEEQIAGRLQLIAPLPMRGGTADCGGTLYYVDCYNASPTSMKDALNHFAKISQDRRPKLYVLGSMAELGLGTHRHHKEIGYNLPHSEADKAILVGANAEIYKTGMLEAGNWSEGDISVFKSAEDAKAEVSNFKGGAVFVKGSRVCALENALPDKVLEAINSAGQSDNSDIQGGNENFAASDIDEAEADEEADADADEKNEEFQGSEEIESEDSFDAIERYDEEEDEEERF